MEYIGIDLGSRKSHICIRGANAEVLLETTVKTSELGTWLGSRAPSQVIVETCSESFAVADLAEARGHTVKVVPATVVKQLGVGHRGLKNDRRDARVLSRAAVALGEELPQVHVPSHASRHVSRLLASRSNLVRARTQVINGIKGQLRGKLIQLRSGSTSTLSQRVRDKLQSPDEHLLFEPLLQAFDALCASIRSLDAAIKNATQDDVNVQRLRTVPGVGPLTAAAFVAAIDGLERFPNAARLASYLGLTPGEQTTGGKVRHTRITRAGKAHLRTLLIQASWTHIRVARQTALTERFARLCEGKPKQVAIVATARKLACILYAMWRDQTPFRKRQGVRPSTTSDELAAALAP